MKPRYLPVIRLFVSSTFGDLKAERDALQRDAFPRLEAFCRQYGFQFQAIDLRWGVPGEAGLNHCTMRICFEELRRSQDISPEPNFLILLGNRYGWRPLPESISKTEFDQLLTVAMLGNVPGIDAQSAEDVLCDWYYHDKNFCPPGASQEPPLQYLLQSRSRDLQDGKNYGRDAGQKDTADWLAVQRVLWNLVNVAFPPDQLAGRFVLDWDRHTVAVAAGRSPVPQIVRFQGSATEQEIWAGALAVPNPGRHVRAFFREINNRMGFSDTELKDFFDLTERGEVDGQAQQAQAALKNAVAERLGDHAVTLMPHSAVKRENGLAVIDASEKDLLQLCDQVVAQFTEIIRQQIQEHWALSQLPERVASSVDGEHRPIGPGEARQLELERQNHDRFGEERTQQFLGRDGELKQIAAYLADGSNRRPLVVHGLPGTGKTAILAEAAKRTPKNFKPIVRFLGVTPAASDLHGLLVSLCRELEDRVPPETRELPADPDKLHTELLRRLATATEGRPIVIILDALDQLSATDGSRRLAWLPWTLPEHVRLLVSCVSGVTDDDPLGEPYRELKRRGNRSPDYLQQAIAVESLTSEDALTLIDRWLEHCQPPRQLADDQRTVINDRILPDEAIDRRRPLYLRILFEECRRWPSYRPVTPEEIGTNAAALLKSLLTRLNRPEEHGPTVARALGYLVSARRGLSENEILEILWQDKEYHLYLQKLNRRHGHTFPPNATRIPIAIWARLRQELAPYLAEQDAGGTSVLTFYHREFGFVVRELFAAQTDRKRKFHIRLGDHFSLHMRSMTLFRVLDELPWQLLNAREWDRLRCFLTMPEALGRLWTINPHDVKRYWAGIEQHSSYRMLKEYHFDFKALSSIPIGQAEATAALFEHAGHVTQAYKIWDWLIEYYNSHHDHRRLACCLQDQARLLTNRGELRLAMKKLMQAEELLRPLRNLVALQACLRSRAVVMSKCGQVNEAIVLLQQTEQICLTCADKNGLSVSLNYRALLELERGNIERALNLFKESEHIERQIGNFESVVVCLGNQALIAARLGDFHRALDIYKEQETIYRDSGNRHGLQISLGNQSEVYIEWGDFERAFALLREKERICRELVLTESLVKCLANQASLLCRVARAGDAVTLADEAYLLVERHGLVTLRKSIKEVLEFSRTLADARGSAASFVRDETGQQRLTIAKPPELRDLYYIEHPTKGLWSIDGILDGERCRIVLLMFSSQTALEVAHCAQKMMGEQLKLKKMADGWKMREKVRNTIIEGASMDIPMACLEEGAPQFKEMLDCIQTFLR